MSRGIGFELDEEGKLRFVIREYDQLVSYQTYLRLLADAKYKDDFEEASNYFGE